MTDRSLNYNREVQPKSVVQQYGGRKIGRVGGREEGRDTLVLQMNSFERVYQLYLMSKMA